ncbi:MAG: cysteine desulfurase [Clostridiales bacterium]|nr:cysteine desulfurase [Clostridiales bacterium]
MTMEEIYFDNSATTKLCTPAIHAMEEVMNHTFANPSSLHSAGFRAEQALNTARQQVLAALGVRDKGARLVFTSSGTEANNLALVGTVRAKEKYRGGTIILSDSEHASVHECANYLKAKGFTIAYLSTKAGKIDPYELETRIDEKTILLSIMHVNNELGSLYDLSTLFRIAKQKKPDIITHTDAVQSFMKIPFTPQQLGADLVSVSSHKIHGPKGAGALYISEEIIKQKKISPLLFGGGQEYGFRSGTENTISIAGFGAAAQYMTAHMKENFSKATQVRLALIEKLPPAIRVNAAETYSPYIINITVPGIKSETMLHYLSSRGIYVSSGSACSSHKKAPSRPLSAYGLSAQEADCSLRISLCGENTICEANKVAEALHEGLDTLVHTK